VDDGVCGARDDGQVRRRRGRGLRGARGEVGDDGGDDGGLGAGVDGDNGLAGVGHDGLVRDEGEGLVGRAGNALGVPGAGDGRQPMLATLGACTCGWSRPSRL